MVSEEEDFAKWERGIRAGYTPAELRSMGVPKKPQPAAQAIASFLIIPVRALAPSLIVWSVLWGTGVLEVDILSVYLWLVALGYAWYAVARPGPSPR